MARLYILYDGPFVPHDIYLIQMPFIAQRFTKILRLRRVHFLVELVIHFKMLRKPGVGVFRTERLNEAMRLISVQYLRVKN